MNPARWPGFSCPGLGVAAFAGKALFGDFRVVTRAAIIAQGLLHIAEMRAHGGARGFGVARLCDG